MSLNTSLYDSATVEMFLMEDLPLEGRKADLKLLMKHLHSAKSGLMKTVLLTGEPGIGKSALLSAFANIAQKGHSSFVLDLRSSHLTSYEKFFIAFAEKSIEASSQILENALQQILESTPTLNLQWTRDDLLEALAILEVNGLSHPDERHKAKLQEQLLRKFRKSAHPIQPFKPSSTSQDEMEKLITILMNPAITIAKSFIRPTQPQIQKVFKIAQFLRQEHFSDTSPLAKALSNIISETEASENLYESYLSSSTQSKNIARNRLIQDHEQRPQASEYNPQESIASEKSTTKRSLADLALQLNKVLKYIDYLLGTMDAAFVILIDDWDEIVDIPETTREDLKAFLIELFRESSDQKNLKVMLCLSARSAGESYSLGGSFYNIFQNKILLSGLTDGDRDALLLAPLTQANIEVDASILSKIYNLTKGNPFWLLKAQQFLKNWAESIEVSHLNEESMQDLSFDCLEDILEYNFCRIKLNFIYEEGFFHKIIGELLKYYGSKPFGVSEVTEAFKIFPDLTEPLIFEALQSLYHQDFIIEDPLTSTVQEPRYQFQSRVIVDFLKKKTSPIQQGISVDEQVSHLKQIIPLSVKMGELDRKKTQELIAMNHAIGSNELIDFLESTFIRYLEDPNPSVRITAIHNISALPSEKTLEHMIHCLKDEDASVREHATRNLAFLIEQISVGSGFGNNRFRQLIVDALLEASLDSSELVRLEIYKILGQFHAKHDLWAVFVKGISDPSNLVRAKAAQTLSEIENPPLELRQYMLKLIEDRDGDVRRYGFKGLERFLESHTDVALVALIESQLRNEQDPTVRIAALEALVQSRSLEVLPVVSNLLSLDNNEDVRIAAARCLGKWSVWPKHPAEEILLKVISEPYLQPATVLWSCIRSLGQIGESTRAIDALNAARPAMSNEILETAVEMAVQKIVQRLRGRSKANPQTQDSPSDKAFRFSAVDSNASEEPDASTVEKASALQHDTPQQYSDTDDLIDTSLNTDERVTYSVS